MTHNFNDSIRTAHDLKDYLERHDGEVARVTSLQRRAIALLPNEDQQAAENELNNYLMHQNAHRQKVLTKMNTLVSLNRANPMETIDIEAEGSNYSDSGVISEAEFQRMQTELEMKHNERLANMTGLNQAIEAANYSTNNMIRTSDYHGALHQQRHHNPRQIPSRTMTNEERNQKANQINDVINNTQASPLTPTVPLEPIQTVVNDKVQILQGPQTGNDSTSQSQNSMALEQNQQVIAQSYKSVVH